MEQALEEAHVYSQYALDHPDEFQVVAVAEPDKERRGSYLQQRHQYSGRALLRKLRRASWKRKAGRLCHDLHHGQDAL